MTHYQIDLIVDPTAFRQTMSLFTTGITVLTTYQENGEPVGMTANAVTSVSLNPPLLLVCVSRDANILPHLQKSEGFTLNILSEDQEELSSYFASIWSRSAPPPPYTFVDWRGGPRLEGAIGAITCKHYRQDEAGDHIIFLGEVTDLYRGTSTEEPLLFYRGLYRGIGPL